MTSSYGPNLEAQKSSQEAEKAPISNLMLLFIQLGGRNNLSFQPSKNHSDLVASILHLSLYLVPKDRDGREYKNAVNHRRELPHTAAEI